MADPVGIALGALALIDVIYVRSSKLWKAYKVSQDFGLDFQQSYVRLGANEVNFNLSLTAFHKYLRVKGRTTEWIEQKKARRTIHSYVEAMIIKFNECFAIVEKFEKLNTGATQNNKDSHSVQVLAAHSLIASSVGQFSPENLEKLSVPHQRHLRESLSSLPSFIEKLRQNRSRSSSPSNQSNTSDLSLLDPHSSISTSLDLQSQKGRFEIAQASDTDGRQLNKQAGTRNLAANTVFEFGDGEQDQAQSFKESADIRQKLVSGRQKLVWAHHGKTDFEDLIRTLFEMNQELKDMLPALELPSSFNKIRGDQPRSYLWERTAEVRKALEALNITLRRANKPDLLPDGKLLKITVRLENNHGDTTQLLEERTKFYNALPLRGDPIAFRLTTFFQKPGDGATLENLEALVCTSITQPSGVQIQNIAQKLQEATIPNNPEDQFAELGHLPQDPYNTWSVHKEVQSQELRWLDEKTLDDCVTHSNFTDVQRIELATKIAMAHLHFASINRGFSLRCLSSYRYFRYSTTKAKDWTIPFTSIPWLDYGFGSPAQSASRISLNAPPKDISTRIDPAKELGVLLYQITSGKKIDYPRTVAGLEDAIKKARKSLDDILGVCGLVVKEIVEVCFGSCPPQQWTSGGQGMQEGSFVIIEEVTAALLYHSRKKDVN